MGDGAMGGGGSSSVPEHHLETLSEGHTDEDGGPSPRASIPKGTYWTNRYVINCDDNDKNITDLLITDKIFI